MDKHKGHRGQKKKKNGDSNILDLLELSSLKRKDLSV